MKRFEVGARVSEPTYGLGSIVAVEDGYVRVQFDEHGIKKFQTSLSRLEPSNEPRSASARPTATVRRRRKTTKTSEPAE